MSFHINRNTNGYLWPSLSVSHLIFIFHMNMEFSMSRHCPDKLSAIRCWHLFWWRQNYRTLDNRSMEKLKQYKISMIIFSTKDKTEIRDKSMTTKPGYRSLNNDLEYIFCWFSFCWFSWPLWHLQTFLFSSKNKCYCIFLLSPYLAI